MLLRFAALIFFSLLSISVAFSFSIARSGDALILSDSSCDKVLEKVRTLYEWSKKTGSSRECLIDAKRATALNGCSYDISNCVPEHVLKYQGVFPKTDKPDCWNLALVMSNILPSLRLTQREEITFYMNSPLCRQLKNSEKQEAGDIGLIRDRESEAEIHGFIYISDEMSYSKNGSDKSTPFAVQPVEAMSRYYNPTSTTEYFRCQTTMSDYLATISPLPEPIKCALDNFDRIDRCLSEYDMELTTLPAAAIELTFDTMKALTHYFNDELKSRNKLELTSEESDFILGSLQIRISAIYQDLTGFSDHRLDRESADELYDLDHYFREAVKNLK